MWVVLTYGLFGCLRLCLCSSLCCCILVCLRLCLCLRRHIFLEQRLPLNAGGRESRMNGLDTEKELLATIFTFNTTKPQRKLPFFLRKNLFVLKDVIHKSFIFQKIEPH